MTLPIKWISLQEVYGYVLNIRRLPERAHNEIIEKLSSNELGAKASTLRFGYDFMNMKEDADRPINSSLFLDGHVDFENSSLLKPQGAGSANLWRILAVEALGIQVLEEEVREIWSRSEDKGKNAGGRKEEHSWSAAIAYCGWYVANKGLPIKKKDLHQLAREWFDKFDAGVPKDDRTLERRISQAYDELERLTQETGSKP